jgi:hypothetical protein
MIEDSHALVSRIFAQSPSAMSRADALAHIEERRRSLLASPPLPEPDITPEPIPIVDDPVAFAREFWGDARKPKKSRGSTSQRKPADRQRGPFRLIDGGKNGEKQK